MPGTSAAGPAGPARRRSGAGSRRSSGGRRSVGRPGPRGRRTCPGVRGSGMAPRVPVDVVDDPGLGLRGPQHGRARPSRARPPMRRPARSATTAALATEMTMALRVPTLRNSCGPSSTGTRTPTMSSPGDSAVRLGPTQNSPRRDRRAGPTVDCTSTHGVERGQHRQGVAGGRGGGQVAADRAGVADLGRPDGAGRLGQGRAPARPGRGRPGRRR